MLCGGDVLIHETSQAGGCCARGAQPMQVNADRGFLGWRFVFRKVWEVFLDKTSINSMAFFTVNKFYIALHQWLVVRLNQPYMAPPKSLDLLI